MTYSISEFAQLCGITPTTLRAWQRRYGLLKPLRTDGGHRIYSNDDVNQALIILDWLRKGVPISQIKNLLDQPIQSDTNNWVTLQETMLDRLNNGKIDALRQMLYECGREYPRDELVKRVLRPLRQKISANIATMVTLREVLDGLILAYTSFCLESDKKAGGDRYMLAGWKLSDPGELWLEALMRTGKGKRIDMLPFLSSPILPPLFSQHHWVLITVGEITPLDHKKIDEWKENIISLDLVTL